MSLEVDILIDGKVKKIEIVSPKGKHQKKYLKVWSEIAKKEVDPDSAMQFLRMRDNMVMELTTIKESELDDMPITEKEKILQKIEDLILMRKREDFLPSSQKQQK